MPQLTALRVPEGVDETAFSRSLADLYGIEIGGGLGPLSNRIWRIGLMGESSPEENVATFLDAMDDWPELGG